MKPTILIGIAIVGGGGVMILLGILCRVLYVIATSGKENGKVWFHGDDDDDNGNVVASKDVQIQIEGKREIEQLA